ncbi:MAG: glycosyltransferase [Culicoidibacterales bacterium]
MILVLLGTQKIQFNRLIEQLITLKQTGVILANEVIIQSGFTGVDAKIGFKVHDFFPHKQLESLVKEADLIITHGGAGSLFEALNAHKRVIALPRLVKYGEHVDDHQIELVQMLFAENYIIAEANLSASFTTLANFEFKAYASTKVAVINKIKELIN